MNTVDLAGRRQRAGAFDGRTIAVVIGAALIGFMAYWVLSAFSPQLSSGQNGGAHGLSRGATGYSALVELLRASGTPIQINRTGEPQAGLLIVTPPPQTGSDTLTNVIEAHVDGEILIVLPKWDTMADPDRRGWVRRMGIDTDRRLLTQEPLQLRGQLGAASAGNDPRLAGWASVQAWQGTGVEPIVVAADGRIVVGRLTARREVLILFDADLIANHGIGERQRALSAVRLIRSLADGRGVIVDVGLNGLGAGRSVLRLAFTPPFLGLTLCLLVAGLLALWSGFQRFGPAWLDHRAVAFGKLGLVESTARLIVQAGRTRHVAQAYADQVRDTVARRLHAPHGMDPAALSTWLDRFGGEGGQNYTRLSSALHSARNASETVAAARRLGEWRKEVLRERD